MKMSNHLCCTISGFCLGSLFVLTQAQPTPQVASGTTARDGHESINMDMDMSVPDQIQNGLAQQAALKDKKESEFNHHLAGFLVALAGLFLLGESALRSRWPSVRFCLACLLPSCWLVPARVQRHGALALWPSELVARPEPQPRRLAAQDLCLDPAGPWRP